ncbi:hypothetical protein WJX75_004020 [Coccomyxa subellipsoidea]|uniref:Uncharacterized protein n=1 Tax=Coccomyxa subellipsoidea TaxID=248742 RepID=A0ABR2YVV6_9CHLO
MKAVITGEQMQMELLELLQSLPDDEATEAFQTVVMKCLVKLAQLCDLYETVFPRLDTRVKILLWQSTLVPASVGVYHRPSIFYHDPSFRERLAEKAAQVEGPIQLLAALPALFLGLRGLPSGGAAFALTALEALKSHRNEWNIILQMHGLPADTELDPTSPWVCTYAARYQWTAKRDTFEAMQELRPGLATAEEQNNEPKACPLLWMYCHLLLLTGNVPGHSAMEAKALLDSWGEFRCTTTGGWTPLRCKLQAIKEEYLRSLVMAMRFKKAVRHNPDFANTELPAFTQKKLDLEVAHFRSSQNESGG